MSDAHDGGTDAFQNADLRPGTRAILPVKANVRLALVLGGSWSPSSHIEVQFRSRSGSTSLSLSGNSIETIPADTLSVVLTPVRAGSGFNVMARILPLTSLAAA